MLAANQALLNAIAAGDYAGYEVRSPAMVRKQPSGTSSPPSAPLGCKATHIPMPG